MVSRLKYASFPPRPVKLYQPGKCSKPKQPQPNQLELELQLAVAQRHIRQLEAENLQLRSQSAQHQEQLLQKDVELVQQQQQIALQQQQLEQQALATAEVRQHCEKQQMQLQALEQLLAFRTGQQQQPVTPARGKSRQVPAAVATSRPAVCASKKKNTMGSQASMANESLANRDCKLLQPAPVVDSVEYPGTPDPIDSRCIPSPRSSSSSSDDGSSCSSRCKEQSAPAASNWWGWSTANTPSNANTTSTANSSSMKKGSSNMLSSWWLAGAAVDITAGVAGHPMKI